MICDVIVVNTNRRTDTQLLTGFTELKIKHVTCSGVGHPAAVSKHTSASERYL